MLALPTLGSRCVSVIAVLLLVCGCGGSLGGVTSSSIGVAPVVLSDTSPGQLQVFVAITLGGYNPATRETASIDINLQSSGRPVKFVADESVSCGAGTALKRFIGSFEGTFRKAEVEGKTVICQYTTGQVTTPLVFRVPAGLVILSPRENDSVPASGQTDVAYRSGLGTSLFVVALAPQAKAWARPENTTPTHATFDTSSLHGAGSISLTQQFDHIDIQAAPFKASAGRVQSMTMISVTWV